MSRRYRDDPSLPMNPQQALAPSEPERPVGAIVTEIWDNTQWLVRNELALALSQLKKETHQAKSDLTRVSGAGAMMYTGLLSIVVAAVLLLSKAVELWLSALIVGLAVATVGYFLLPRAHHRKESPASDARRDAESAAYKIKEAST